MSTTPIPGLEAITSVLFNGTKPSTASTMKAVTTATASSHATTLIPSPTITPTNSAISSHAQSDGANLSIAARAGIGVGAGVLILFIILGSILILRKRRHRLPSTTPQLSDDRSPEQPRRDEEKAEHNTTTAETDENGRMSPESRQRNNLATVSEEWASRPLSRVSEVQHTPPLAPQHFPAELISLIPSERTISPQPHANNTVARRFTNGATSPPPMSTEAVIRRSMERAVSPQFNSPDIPSRRSSNRFATSPVVSRERIRRRSMEVDRIRAASDRGASSPRTALKRSRSSASEPGDVKEMLQVVRSSSDENSRADVLGRLREEHARIQEERARLLRLQELDEEEDWIRQQIAEAEMNNGFTNRE